LLFLHIILFIEKEKLDKKLILINLTQGKF